MQPRFGTYTLTTSGSFGLIKLESRVRAHSLTTLQSFVDGVIMKCQVETLSLTTFGLGSSEVASRVGVLRFTSSRTCAVSRCYPSRYA